MEIPLLHDHHSHPLLYAAFHSAANLSAVKSFDEAAELLVQSQKDSEHGIALGYGWKDNYFPIGPSQLATLPPCAIFNLSLHKLLVNDAGKQMLLEKMGPDVEKISNHDWYERNLRVVLNWFAKLGGSPDALVTFYEYLRTVGVESAEEMLLVDGEEIDWFRTAGLIERTRFWVAPDTMRTLSADQRLAASGFKLFTDGALGAWTAAISKSYPGLEATKYPTGMLLYTDAELAKTLNDCAEQAGQTSNRLGIAIHAIGDRAIEQTVESVEQMDAERRKAFSIIRIEHAQMISLDQARRAKELGIVLSMQPNFSVDSVDYADRLPSGFAERNNPFRMVIDEASFVPGVDLIFGSDGMPHGVEYATAQSFSPAFESQLLTKEEFIAGYTL